VAIDSEPREGWSRHPDLNRGHSGVPIALSSTGINSGLNRCVDLGGCHRLCKAPDQDAVEGDRVPGAFRLDEDHRPRGRVDDEQVGDGARRPCPIEDDACKRSRPSWWCGMVRARRPNRAPYERLRKECEAIGRPFEEITLACELTVSLPKDPAKVGAIIDLTRPYISRDRSSGSLARLRPT
jgi:hypothetical protein